jgi:NAD(P)-dependent dehydrogenase (short-subunit alcohol dehydrogenase family)
LVTGCSTGIGFATAVRLGTVGFDVIGTMRDPDRDGSRLLQAAAAAGSRVRVARLDVTDDRSVAKAFEDAGEVNVLVNNAAIVCAGSAEETDVSEWQEVFDTNLFGAVRCLRAALPGMRERGRGCIVNVGSAAGHVGLPGVSAYAASKAALEATSEMVAIEGYRYGIRVVLIETGATATAMGRKVRPPSSDSPYWEPMGNTFAWLGAQRASISSADVLAHAIAQAVLDPASPFRVVAGQGSEHLLRARRAATDEEWISAAGGTLDEFQSAYRRLAGVTFAGDT